MDVEDGWDKAVETVLGDYLQAVCVSDITPITENIASLKAGNVTILREHAKGGLPLSTENSLTTKVSGAPAAVEQLLSTVTVAQSLGQALSIRESLPDNGSVITEDGVWLGKEWLRVARDKDGKAGVLAREHEMRRLKSDIREMQARHDSAKKLLNDGRIRLVQLEDRREAVQEDAAALLKEYSELKAALESARYKVDQANARKTALAEEVVELQTEQISAEEQLRESKRVHGHAAESLERLNAEKANLEAQREELKAELDRVREQASEDRQSVQNIAIQFESRRTSKESAAQNLERMKRQLVQFQTREAEIREQLEMSQSPLAGNKEELEEQLTARVEIEEQLGAARQKVEKVENELRELDQSRMQIDQSVDSARTKVSEAEMATQELKVRREGLAEQLAQTDFELATLLEEMAEGADIESWEEKLEKVRRRIDRLGPINLAAIDEFKEQSERKEYLDSQLADLNDALQTLEGAIRKIDRETRTRFKETYDNVNDGFKVLFRNCSAEAMLTSS